MKRNPQPIRLPAWLKPLRGAITLAMKRARIRRFNHARSARS